MSRMIDETAEFIEVVIKVTFLGLTCPVWLPIYWTAKWYRNWKLNQRIHGE